MPQVIEKQLSLQVNAGVRPICIDHPAVFSLPLSISRRPAKDITQQFSTLKEEILRGVFRQKAAAAFWLSCRKSLNHGHFAWKADAWLNKTDAMSHSWPKSTTVGKFQVDDLISRTFHLYRNFARARHLWLSLRPDWWLIKTHMYTDQPGNYAYK